MCDNIFARHASVHERCHIRYGFIIVADQKATARIAVLEAENAELKGTGRVSTPHAENTVLKAQHSENNQTGEEVREVAEDVAPSAAGSVHVATFVLVISIREVEGGGAFRVPCLQFCSLGQWDVFTTNNASQLHHDVMAPTRSGDEISKKRRGRPPGSRKAGTVAKRTTKPTTSKRLAKRKPSSQKDAEDELSIVQKDRSQQLRTRKRKADADLDEIAEEQSKSRKKYVQLETRTKRIAQEQIDTWPQVSPQVLEQIVAVVRDAKKDIANTQRDERKVIAAHNTLNPLVKRLARQLAASRIPPQAQDIHFNIDKLTERNAQVSREVTTARHSKQLLGEQVQVAQSLLKKDEENLEQLKKNAKQWRTEWKHQEKHGRLHPLLQDLEDTEMHRDGPDDIGLKRSEPVDLSLLEAPDAQLAPVLEQVRRSLENMQGNHAQVEGVDEAIRDAQAALDDVLFKHTSAQQYAAI